MKKILLLISMLALLCTLGACAGANGSGMSQGEAILSDAEAVMYAESLVDMFDSTFTGGSLEEAVQYYEQNYPIMSDALRSYVSLLDEIGQYGGVISSEVKGSTADTVTVEVQFAGSLRNAAAEIVFTQDGYKSITMSAHYTMAEKMQKAAMNTLIGMGTVFAILILISLIISLFSFIPGAGKLPSKNSVSNAASSSEKAVDNATAQIGEREEKQALAEASDSTEAVSASDEELIAVISAAIAAYESGVVAAPGVIVQSRPGTGDLDTFVVRSIRRVGKRAGK